MHIWFSIYIIIRLVKKLFFSFDDCLQSLLHLKSRTFWQWPIGESLILSVITVMFCHEIRRSKTVVQPCRLIRNECYHKSLYWIRFLYRQSDITFLNVWSKSYIYITWTTVVCIIISEVTKASLKQNRKRRDCWELFRRPCLFLFLC